MLYFSDHGDEVFDFRNHFGRSATSPSKYMVDVPLLLRFSEAYRGAQDVTALEGWHGRPYQLNNLIHTIIDLANLRTDLLDERKSLVSEAFVAPPRFSVGRPYLLLPPRSCAIQTRLTKRSPRSTNSLPLPEGSP